MAAVKEVVYSEFTEEDFIYSFLYNNIYPEFKGKNFSFKLLKSDNNTKTYLLFVDNEKYIIVCGSNNLRYGLLRDEYNNLKNLNRRNKDIVLRPKYYYTDGFKELYVTDYLYNIQRIASTGEELAIYPSKKSYEEVKLNSYQKNIINTALAYNLVRLYDDNRELAPSQIDISAGDFVYCDDWDLDKINMKDSIDCMRLTRAKEIIRIPFKDYLNLLRKELVNNKYSLSKQSSLILTDEFSNFMSRDQVEKAISLAIRYKRNL